MFHDVNSVDLNCRLVVGVGLHSFKSVVRSSVPSSQFQISIKYLIDFFQNHDCILTKIIPVLIFLFFSLKREQSDILNYFNKRKNDSNSGVKGQARCLEQNLGHLIIVLLLLK